MAVIKPKNALFLNKTEDGYLVLVDKAGVMIPGQCEVAIKQEVGELTRVTATFLLNPENQMYKEVN